MERVLVILKHSKAKKLLQDLDEMDIIEVTDEAFLRKGNSSSTVSLMALKDLIQTPMKEEAIDQQLKQLRNEW